LNISFVIFCFNEEGNIARVFEQTHQFAQANFHTFEIIIVNDGSADNTGKIADEIAHQFSFVNYIAHTTNMGIGMALKNGYQAAQYEYVCALPGDGQFDINALSIVRPFLPNIYYSFYRPNTNYNFYRRVLSWCNRLFNQHVLGIYLRDVNWIKVYRNDQLAWAQLELESSLIESEMCAKLYKMRIMPIEVPTVYLQRQWGYAKGGNWKTLSAAMLETFKLITVVYRFKPKKIASTEP